MSSIRRPRGSEPLVEQPMEESNVTVPRRNTTQVTPAAVDRRMQEDERVTAERQNVYSQRQEMESQAQALEESLQTYLKEEVTRLHAREIKLN